MALALATLLDAQAVITDGVWQHLGNRAPLSVCVEGTFVGTVQILVSNSLGAPLDSDNGKPQLGEDFTAPGFATIDQPFRWIKARVTTLDSGTVSANVFVGRHTSEVS